MLESDGLGLNHGSAVPFIDFLFLCVSDSSSIK